MLLHPTLPPMQYYPPYPYTYHDRPSSFSHPSPNPHPAPSHHRASLPWPSTSAPPPMVHSSSFPPRSSLSDAPAPLGPPPLAKIGSSTSPPIAQLPPPAPSYAHSRHTHYSPVNRPHPYPYPPTPYSSHPIHVHNAEASGSRSSMSEVEGEDEFMAHQTRGPGGAATGAAASGKKKKGKSVRDERDELDDSPPASPNPRAEKRRRTRKPAGAGGDKQASPSVGSAAGGQSPSSAEAPVAASGVGQEQQRRTSGMAPAPIKPIGFAASRENRRESGGIVGEPAVPSPVVMGFDFQKVDEDQLKTVRDTISIKAQQEALIAQRRRDLAASTPNTPKELTFKGWQPKDPDRLSISGNPSGAGSVGRRRDKTRDKVERMSIVTAGGGDKDSMVPGSKSAPLNQNLSAQQQSDRGELPSGSQTSVPSGQTSGHHPNGMIDPRTAPMSNVRGSRADEGEFTRQQAVPITGQYYRRYEPSHSHNRSVTEGGPRTSSRVAISSSRGGYDDRMPPPTAHRNGHHPGHPGHSSGYPQEAPSDTSPSPPPPSRSLPSAHMPPTTSSAPPQMSARREAFLAPYNQLYDLLHQADSLRYSLQDLMHRYESVYSGQVMKMQEFKGTMNSSNTLLATLQQSADSLKEMVRYEIGRVMPQAQAQAQAQSGTSGGGEGKEKEKEKEEKVSKEMEEMRERIKKLEEKLAEKSSA